MAREVSDRQPRSEEAFCADFNKDIQEKRHKRRSKPQPWILLKFAVFLTLGIIGFATYVYVDRFCLPMLTDREATGDRAFGVAFLAVFGVFLIMMLWAYAKVCLTSPGFAKDHVQPTPRPEMPSHHTTDDIAGPPYQNDSSSSSPTQPSLARPPPAHHNVSRTSSDHTALQSKYTSSPSRIKTNREQNPPSPGRRPPLTPTLVPAYRYCEREGLVKPLRAHHCRACGKCVLKYDHHCPWIGQCVGARNHKFFLQFVFWTFLFCAWTFPTLLLGLLVLPRNREDPDILQIVIVVLIGLFGLFTLTMFGTHTRLILLNMTTVEQMRVQDMKEHESAVLADAYPMCAFTEKRRARARWDEEWGRPAIEGNIWWLGSRRKNWESVMGQSIWSWFFPIGKADSDGLDYSVNPRFDKQGRLRRRVEWPPHLR